MNGLLETLIAVITILGSAFLGVCAYAFNWLRSEFRELKVNVSDSISSFKGDVNKRLDSFQAEVQSGNAALKDVASGFDTRLKEIEKDKKRR